MTIQPVKLPSQYETLRAQGRDSQFLEPSLWPSHRHTGKLKVSESKIGLMVKFSPGAPQAGSE